MEDELDKLIEAQWGFLHQDWPVVNRTKFHRTDIKPIQDMRKVKDFVQHRLGVIPVFFFLTVLFGTRCYTGPYRNVEKGVLILYMLLQGTTVSDMGEFLPKNTFHDIIKSFFGTNTHALDMKLTSCLAEMCSSIKLRLLCSRSLNPETFKHITLHLDGHNSRVAYHNADKASMYSYKLRKSGFRAQVCCDMNSIVVFVSQPAECRDFNDGTMLSKMAIDKKIHQLDCLALDGGYTLHLEGVIAASDTLTSANFCYPIRKRRGIELTEEESGYNAVFGSFRSRVESYFGDMQTTFTKFSHTVVNRVSDRSIFSLQYKLCCLLLNIKRMVALRNITAEQHHSFWIQDDFDFPDGEESTVDMQAVVPSFKVKVKDARIILRLQENFLRLTVSGLGAEQDHEMANNDGQEYEIERILGHRGEGESLEYHVLWKGYDISHSTWEVTSQFNNQRTIETYWNSLRTF
ncbi:hypothetical protein EC957_008459 [Mortierella hygrophila]|uniref:Chromo domain-containing protein n=1 Tax=Mortierella hygrophila TaxID=979708 RepID=A0A9P6FC98_9FUNG|nr:hypothetical protein EC957_008459 [Mortierella hygrophila]